MPVTNVTGRLDFQWYKLLGIALFKLGTHTVTITCADIDAFSSRMGSGACIVAQQKGDELTLRLVNGDEAMLAGAGALPSC